MLTVGAPSPSHSGASGTLFLNTLLLFFIAPITNPHDCVCVLSIPRPSLDHPLSKGVRLEMSGDIFGCHLGGGGGYWYLVGGHQGYCSTPYKAQQGMMGTKYQEWRR